MMAGLLWQTHKNEQGAIPWRLDIDSVESADRIYMRSHKNDLQLQIRNAIIADIPLSAIMGFYICRMDV